MSSPFFSSTVDGGDWLATGLSLFAPEEIVPDTQWIGGLEDPRASLKSVEKRKVLPVPRLEHQPFSS
jgi:hypothetical protein